MSATEYTLAHLTADIMATWNKEERQRLLDLFNAQSHELHYRAHKCPRDGCERCWRDAQRLGIPVVPSYR
jgi:hypothetical protein